MTKRIITILVLVVLGTATVSADIISSSRRAATVSLYSPEIIYVKQLDEQTAAKEQELRLQGMSNVQLDRRDVLDGMISDILLLQEADHRGITLTDAELNNRLSLEKAGLQQMAGRSLSDDEFRQFTARSFGSFDSYVENIKNQELVKKLILSEKKDQISGVARPTDEAIQDAYRKNKLSFVRPRYVRFDHITVDTRNLQGDELAAAQDAAEAIARDIRNGTKSFDDYMKEFSTGAVERRVAGDFGWIGENESQFENLYGKEFFDAVMNLKPGVPTGVVRSNAGLHILRYTDEVDQKILELDDQISPRSNVTVRQQISNALYQQALQAAFMDATRQVVADLRGRADINIFEENL